MKGKNLQIFDFDLDTMEKKTLNCCIGSNYRTNVSSLSSC